MSGSTLTASLGGRGLPGCDVNSSFHVFISLNKKRNIFLVRIERSEEKREKENKWGGEGALLHHRIIMCASNHLSICIAHRTTFCMDTGVEREGKDEERVGT